MLTRKSSKQIMESSKQIINTLIFIEDTFWFLNETKACSFYYLLSNVRIGDAIRDVQSMS